MGFAKLELREALWEDSNGERAERIRRHIPYVKSLVNRMAASLPPSVDYEDLVYAGIVGLIEAVDAYEPSYNTKFITYALFRIRGAILSELRSRDFLSRTDRKRIREMDKAYDSLEHRLGNAFSDEDVAKEMGIDLDTFYEIKALSRISFISSDEMRGELEEQDEIATSLAEEEGPSDYCAIHLKQLHEALAKSIETLSERERIVLSLYYDEELNMKEIAAVLRITESRVSQIHSQAVARLRRKLRREDFLEG